MAVEDDLRSFDQQALCTTCQSIMSGDLTRFESTDRVDGIRHFYDQPHHKTFASFCAAVEKGCYICTRFREHGLITAFDEQVASREGELAAQNPFTTYRVVLLPDDPQPIAAVDIGWGGPINMMRFISYRSR